MGPLWAGGNHRVIRLQNHTLKIRASILVSEGLATNNILGSTVPGGTAKSLFQGRQGKESPCHGG